MSANSLAWLVGRLIGQSVDPSLLLFVFLLTNAQLDLMKKHSEAMSDEIVTAMSTACGASIFLFELYKKTYKQFVVLVTK